MKKMITNGLLGLAIVASASVAQAADRHMDNNVDAPFNDVSIEQVLDTSAYSPEKVNTALNLANMMNDYEIDGTKFPNPFAQLLQVARTPLFAKQISDNPQQLVRALNAASKGSAQGVVDSYGAMNNEFLLAVVKQESQEHAHKLSDMDLSGEAFMEVNTGFIPKFPLAMGVLKDRGVDIHKFMSENATKNEYDALAKAKFWIADSDFLSMDVDLLDEVSGEKVQLGQILLNGCVCSSTLDNGSDDVLVVVPSGVNYNNYTFGSVSLEVDDAKAFLSSKYDISTELSTYSDINVTYREIDGELIKSFASIDAIDRPDDTPTSVYTDKALHEALQTVGKLHVSDDFEMDTSAFASSKIKNHLESSHTDGAEKFREMSQSWEDNLEKSVHIDDDWNFTFKM